MVLGAHLDFEVESGISEGKWKIRQPYRESAPIQMLEFLCLIGLIPLGLGEWAGAKKLH